LMEVDVRAFGNQFLDTPNLKVRGFPVETSKLGCPKNLQSIFGAVKRCFDFNATGIDADVVHCHTWYTHLGGILAYRANARPGAAKTDGPSRTKARFREVQLARNRGGDQAKYVELIEKNKAFGSSGATT